MTKDTHTTVSSFRENLVAYLSAFRQALATDNGDWIVKGFIDVYRNIYTISLDTKVLSKIIELLLFPMLCRFATEHGYRVVLSEHQNFYPDMSLIAPDETKIALDLKSTYRKDEEKVNGFTLGAFTGYFRQRQSTKNICFPYEQYAAHFVLGVIYSRKDLNSDELRVYDIEDLNDIVSVLGDFTLLLWEKWQIASDHPGSGNTKNIGSPREIEVLIEGTGPFADYSERIFDDYWMNYLTRDMAQAIDSQVPYRNIDEYWDWRGRVPETEANTHSPINED